MKKTGKIIKSQIGIILIVLLVGSALGYAFFGRSHSRNNQDISSTQAVSPLGDAKGVSCGIAPKGTPTGGCGMMGGNRTQTTSSQPVVQADPQAQLITMNYEESGLTPATINVEAGKSYTIVIKINKDVVGCMNTISIPGLDENIQNVNKGSILTFNIKPTSAGTYEFKCAMGVSHGAKIIVK
ncbi:MAG: cupredoxin domain-containing protein [Candidatus Absconditabacteria bacterium]